MTLQDAIRSGKRFNEPGDEGWYYCEGDNIFYTEESGNKSVTSLATLKTYQIISDKWITEPTQRLLSREDIERAFDEAISPRVQYRRAALCQAIDMTNDGIKKRILAALGL